MQYRNFGKTGEKVSALGFGLMRLPLYDNEQDHIDLKKAHALLHTAYDHGINYYDTAYGYHRSNTIGVKKGASENALGTAFSPAQRDKVFYATKITPFLLDQADEMEFMLNDSLRTLKTDRIDFYLVHSLGQATWAKMQSFDVLNFLEKAKKDGKIRHVGFSFHDSCAVFKQIIDAYDWEFCQIQYNFMDVDVQAGTEGLSYAAAKGLGIAIMEPLRGGKLAAHVPSVVEEVWKKSAFEMTQAERCLNFVWDNPAVGVVLSGMSTMQQLEENITAAERSQIGKFSEQEQDLYTQARAAYKALMVAPCTACQYCMPCPAGVNIPGCLEHRNQIEMYRDINAIRAGYVFIPESARAGKCVACGQCLEKCPQQIDIPRHLHDLQALLGS